MINNDREFKECLNLGVSDTLLEQNGKTIKCKYYDKNSLNLNLNKNNNISFLHLNIRSPPKHFDTFQELICSMENRFKIIALTETRLIANSSISHNLNID